MRIRPQTARLRHVEALELRQYLAGGVDRLVNDNAGSSGTSGFTQAEAVVLPFGNTVLTAFDDSGSFTGTSSHFVGVARSTNSGATFVDQGILPPSTNGDAGEVTLARDELTGRIYMTTLSLTGGTVQVWRSDTNGASWLAPVNGTPVGGPEDTHAITVDNFPGAGRGNVYLVSRRFGASPGLFLYRSTDNGATFIAVAAITAASTVQGGRVVVAPDHSVSVVWYLSGSIATRRSTTFGSTFGAISTVAAVPDGDINGDLNLTGTRAGLATAAPFRTQSFPHVAVNPVSGNLYVVYNHKSSATSLADIFLTQSTDNGATWSFPLRLNDDATNTDQWNPTIAVTPNGARIGVFYYSRQEDPTGNNLYRFYGRTGTISGNALTFTAGSAISDVASFPEFGRDSAISSVYMGDRNVAAATNDAFHIVWSDARSDLSGGAPRKDPNVYYDKIPLAPNGIWTGLSDGVSWNDPDNWSNNTVPGAGDDVIIEVPATNPTILLTGTHSARTLRSTESISVTGRLNMTAGDGSSPEAVVRVSTIAFSGSGAIDLGPNDLIATATPRATIENYVRIAYNFGGWDGPRGIFSSVAKNNPTGNTTLGLLSGQEFLDNNGGPFNGVTVNPSDVLLKYTYFGDVDFNGAVDASDYNLIDFGYTNHLTGWAWGDADWSTGPTDASDYNIIDFAFTTQTTVL